MRELDSDLSIDWVSDLEALDGGVTVVSFHCGGSATMGSFLEVLEELPLSIPKLFSFDAVGSRVLADLKAWEFRHAALRHQRLGGLTTARLSVGWSPGHNTLELGKLRNPARPIGTFLEPSARLTEWRLVQARCKVPDNVWNSIGPDAMPFKWPPQTSRPWVRTKSVYFKDTLIERPLTTKEMAQLLDLREDWGARLVLDVWEWNHRASPPLRFLVEFVLIAQSWLGHSTNMTGAKSMAMKQREACDWSRERYPFGEVVDASGTRRSVLDQQVYLGWFWDPKDAVEVSEAARADDADVDLSLWNVGGDGPGMEEARTVIRNWLWKIWLRRLRRQGIRWLDSDPSWDKETRLRNLEAVQDCIVRCGGSSWWKWDDGSRLYPWRWPIVWRREARDGARGFHLAELCPRLHFNEVPNDDPWAKEKVNEKLRQLVDRRYLEVGPVTRVIPFFWVWKTKKPPNPDIRVVWDGRKNGVNDVSYAPSFQLPTPASFHRILEPYMESGDFDIGEQFPNYMLHPAERQYFGVRLPKDLYERLRQEKKDVAKLMRFGRLPFGWKSSPVLALSMLARALEIVQRAPSDKTSVFAWSTVVLNLPGMEGYDPGLPRVRRKRDDGLTAVILKAYFDDGRVTGPNTPLAVQGLRQATAGIQYLGNQDAARKRRPVSQRPGAWAGSVSYTDQGVLRKLVTQKKWDKTREFLAWVQEHLDSGKAMERKAFKSGVGFMLHVAATYEEMQPYLQGFFLSENMWRGDRDSRGYRQPPSNPKDPSPDELDLLEEEVDLYEEALASHSFHDDEGLENEDWEPPTSSRDWDLGLEPLADTEPSTVVAVPRLKDDVRALQLIFDGDTPRQSIIRPVRGAYSVVYGGGDASGEGFGSLVTPLGLEPLFETGFWCSEASEKSSNYREFRNLKERMQQEAELGRLTGKEVWIATDNSTTSNASYKGRSSSPELDEMILELKVICIRVNCILRFVHVAGRRMIAFGIDGLSRGEMQLGALLREGISGVLPLHLSVFDRAPALRSWVTSWAGEDVHFAEPEDWFYQAQQGGDYGLPQRDETWVWTPPPAAALDALEELGYGRLKRHSTLCGIVLIPTMMEEEWYRRFRKNVDLRFVIPAGAIPEWPLNQYESLTVGLYLPLLLHRPWDWKQCAFMVPLGRSLSALFKAGDPSGGRVYGVVAEEEDPLHVNLRAPEEDDDYKRARPGDHLFCPFECDYCTFYRLKGRLPDEDDLTDQILMMYIRRANIDAFWSRQPSTVAGLLRLFEQQVLVGEAFGFEMFGPIGPYSRSYDSGIRTAIGVLYESRRPGLHEETKKFSSCRKVRSLSTNMHNASARGAMANLVWRSKETRFVATTCPSDSEWHTRFMMGFRSRVGERRKQDAALTIRQMLALQELFEEEYAATFQDDDVLERRAVCEIAVFFILGFCASLRGFELPKIVLHELRRMIQLDDEHGIPAHVGIPMRGKFKQRSSEVVNILCYTVAVTASGLKPGLWVDRLVTVLEDLGVTSGWLFQSDNQGAKKMSEFSEAFFGHLVTIQERDPPLFESGVDILEDFGLARSARRGATTRATNCGVREADIDWTNRWNTGGSEIVRGPMRVQYAEQKQMLATFLRFSGPL